VPEDTYSLLFDVFVLGQRIRRLLAAAMGDSPLRAEEYAVYSVVFEHEAITPTEMAAKLGMPPTTVAEYVHAMEQRGHVRRLAHPRDGRSYVLTLTAAGFRAHRQANARFERAYALLVDALPHGEGPARDAVRDLLHAAEHAESVAGTDPNATHRRAPRRSRARSR
jgi:DNA-binding MarR family transcriptional regulator